MAKTFPLNWSSVFCLAVLLGACAQARIVRRDYPEASPPPRAVASTPAPQKHVSLPQPAVPKPSPPTPTEPVPQSGTYIVKAGDTLYSIARRFGLKFKDVADWNRIAEPYAIQSGQRLHLHAEAAESQVATSKPAPVVPVATTAPSNAQTATVPVVQHEAASATGTSSSSNATSVPPKPTTTGNTVGDSASTTAAVPVVSAPVAVTPAPTTPVTTKPQEAASIKPVVAPPPVIVAPPPVSTTPPTTASTPAPTPAVTGNAIPGGPSWRWPTDGDIIGRYVAGDQTQQGIDISGHSGQPVIAAADGVVVYSGAGLVGYGELVIIKHSEEWLSAYAHNRRRLVAEGTKVKAGEAIAEMGRTGAVSDMLHFEIRRNGKPVDPLLYLPKK